MEVFFIRERVITTNDLQAWRKGMKRRRGKGCFFRLRHGVGVSNLT
jgi:hypothetical protein